MHGHVIEWTDTRIAMLTLMWAQGKAAIVIAGAIDPRCTKNMVIGKAHRLRLPQHPSRDTPTVLIPVADPQPDNPPGVSPVPNHFDLHNGRGP